MKTLQQIATRVEGLRSGDEDFFGFGVGVLIGYLPFALAQPFLKGGSSESDWSIYYDLSEESIIEDMRGYMGFAWGKVENHRGISANRSVDKMTAWLWLLGEEGLVTEASYPQYGAPILAVISRKYDFDIPDDEGLSRMIAGKLCRDGCDEGCDLV